jgi:microcin C transport system substrate-binding protein
VLPRHHFAERSTKEAVPLGSGPYKVKDHVIGSHITYERVRDYWGAGLPVNRGRHNFDTIRYDYYSDHDLAMQAIKQGKSDFRQESIAKNWATGYGLSALREGWLIKENIPDFSPMGMQGYVFNTRRFLFTDARVRWALAHAFNFEAINKRFFYSSYTRTASYFANSDFASHGLPSQEELQVLEPFRGRIPEEVFTAEYIPPSTGDSEDVLTRNLNRARDLLEKAGWATEDERAGHENGFLVHRESGQPFAFEILLNGHHHEPAASAFAENLERLGIVARIHVADPLHYRQRLEAFDYDMIVHVWEQSLSPGNEQRNYWTSAAAVTPGSRNLAGVLHSVVDALVEEVIQAQNRKQLVAATRALDRVLLWGHYVIPHWHIQSFRLVYWNKFGQPAFRKDHWNDVGFLDTWWVDDAKCKGVERWKAEHHLHGASSDSAAYELCRILPSPSSRASGRGVK